MWKSVLKISPPYCIFCTYNRSLSSCFAYLYCLQKLYALSENSLAKLPRICPILASNIKRKIYFCQLTKVFVLNRKLSQLWSAFLTFWLWLHNRFMYFDMWSSEVSPSKDWFSSYMTFKEESKFFSDLLSAVFERLSYSRKCCRAKLFLEKSVLVWSSPWCLLSC